MIRIAYCIHKPQIGGAQLHLLEVLRRLDRRRFEPLMVFLNDGRAEALYHEYQDTGVEIVNLAIPNGLLRPENLKKIYQLVRLLRDRRIDIVHGYLLEGNLVAAVAGRLAGVRLRITSKRSLERHNRKQLLTAKLSNRLSTRVTVVSQAVGEFTHDTEGCPWDKMHVIPNGVHPDGEAPDDGMISDLRRRLGIPENALVVGTVARFGWKKGYPYFVETAALVAREWPNVRFVAFGAGPLKQEIEALVKRLGVGSHVVFPGWEADVRPKLALFDIYVCASIIEGMSNALLEAMAERRPVIATAVGGNRENVIDGETGYLTPPADPSAMAARILELARNPQRASRMGAAGRARVLQEYTIGGMVTQMENLYASLMAGKAALPASPGVRS